jgi:SAM-dependent methyltransferase
MRAVPRVTPSQIDADHLTAIRRSVSAFTERVASAYAATAGRLLDIAPQVHEGARPYFPASVTVETLDIDPHSGCTYIADICACADVLADGTFDYVVCTEVLEHTLRPWDAAGEIWRILKVGGLLFLSVPFNFRIHGPLPDCWRFTEHGLRALFSRFAIVELNALETPDRPLMPIHYTMVARKA